VIGTTRARSSGCCSPSRRRSASWRHARIALASEWQRSPCACSAATSARLFHRRAAALQVDADATLLFFTLGVAAATVGGWLPARDAAASARHSP